MRRRTFLGAALAALTSRVARADAPTSVIVVGGGPAGISAALELAERGVDVTLFEAGSQVGGKCKGWSDTLDGERIDVEHGIHGWWHQYVHFRDLLERYALDGALRDPRRGENGMRLRGGFRVEGYFSRASIFAKRSKERGHGFFPVQYRKGLKWLRDLDLGGIRSRFSGKSVADWTARSPPLTVYSVFDDLMSHSMYFRGPGEIDAAEYIEGERFYFSGKSANARVSWLGGNPQDAIWEPLANAIGGHGGRIARGTPVQRLLVQNERVVGVEVGRPPAEAEIAGPIEEWIAVEVDGERVWVGPGEDGPVALSSRCTHQGCAVARAEAGFACPCHGGRYDDAGQPTGGPPELPLARYVVEPRGKDGFVVRRPDTRKAHYAQHVILAVDVPALQALAGEVLPSVQNLAATREVVARFWLDRDVRASNRPAELLEGFAHACNAFLVHRLQEPSAVWAGKSGGAVVELQAYRGWTGEESEAEMIAALTEELPRIYPELAGVEVLRSHLTVGDGFTWFKPGWREHASPVVSEVDGLLVAGDHVALDDSEAQFMERAVLTGRLAANVILREKGKKAAPILPPA